MEEDGIEGFRACFAELDAPRSGNAQRHLLDEIMMIALVAMLCGAESCVDMALFGRSKQCCAAACACRAACRAHDRSCPRTWCRSWAA